MRKKILFLIFLLPLISNGQNNRPSTYGSDRPFSILLHDERLNRPEELFTVRPVCEKNPIFNCNLILNNNFTPTTPIANQSGTPFNRGWVPNWYASHGTAQLYDYMIPRSAPGIASGFGFMAGISESSGDKIEGIAQRIPTLRKGENYLLSFYKAYSNMFEADGTPKYNPRFKLKIELMYCPDFLLFPEPYNSYDEPSLAGLQHQTIYCEVDPSNLQWQQTAISFVPDNNYNIILITPSLSHFYSPNDNISYGGGIVFGYPELINVNNFSAGSATALDDCMVSIGPATPNCSVAGAVFTWTHTQLNGSIATQTAPPNQQIQIDASNPNNVGTWTLTMSIPTAVITNNSCSQNVPLLTAGVNVLGSSCKRWPKAYSGKAESNLVKSSTGEILMVFEHPGNWPFTPNVNHQGPLPAIPSQAGTFDFHYTSTGITNWITQNNDFPFPIQSSEFVLHGLSNNFHNSNNGVINNPPFFIPNDERIVGELANGLFLTLKQGSNNEIILRNTNSIISSIIIQQPRKIIFNQTTQNLYTIDYNLTYVNGILTGPFIKQFLITSSSINQVNNSIDPSQLNSDGILQITNNNEIYFISGNQIKKLDIATGSLNLVNIAGFNNSDLFALSSSNPYTENRAVVYHETFSELYMIDFSDPANISYKKVRTNNFSSGHYVFDGDDVYLAGPFGGNYCSIGSQQVNFNSGYSTNVLITKLNLITDFYSKNGNYSSQKPEKIINKSLDFQFSIFPNPAHNNIKLEIKNIDLKELYKSYTIILKNLISNETRIIHNYLSNTVIDVSSMDRGQYFVEVINAKGEKAGSKFVKL